MSAGTRLAHELLSCVRCCHLQAEGRAMFQFLSKITTESLLQPGLVKLITCHSA